MGIIFPLVIPTMCQLSDCDEDSVLQSSAAILASSLFGNGRYVWLCVLLHVSPWDCVSLITSVHVFLMYIFTISLSFVCVYMCVLLVISPIAGICILTVFASECDLASHIRSAAVSGCRGNRLFNNNSHLVL